ncbi:MAG: hypothetical protein A2566_01235 [Candidatus Zambryskibacteria bacterium RIFOXYD1_FULL_40_13]|nr:MAG: Intein-containing protein [Parcubacteria group bacterium GW2011_GWC1_39_12]KKR19010.1 MAG: Intein-containing protein [Parcubacteria group bacterium GW2011_GWF1_39_37]KKR35434.1 MAG: Intein-containing protein [Parcubacteria group bacterium GW2011_GWC2_40_10]KKR51925.1 MAG: Intein-containing protein [Parcubacteria group bacterium GW2011_GWE1_40_20]KKR65786.1 MAG: Intein-containing protein [Parcubacteria group bacterium GW2011_GWB1_40_5]KKR68590.1 MAG: Intein-containing protein [Parcubact
MGKRGPKPKGKVKIKWSGNFAYAIGLLATDGCLSPDGRHITLTSKDLDQLETFMKCVGIKNKIGLTTGQFGRSAFKVQFGDILFVKFLESIGLSQAKSLVLGKIDLPPEYFFDFLRGCFDGDGCSYSYWDPRWRSSFMFYVGFSSGSLSFIKWIREEVKNRLSITGHITSAKKKNTYYQLKYAKYEGIKLVRELYKKKSSVCLKRKKLKINESLDTIGVSLIK